MIGERKAQITYKGRKRIIFHLTILEKCLLNNNHK